MSLPPALLRSSMSKPMERFGKLDLLDQVVLAAQMNEVLLEGQAAIAGMRRAAIRSLRASGYTLAEIGEKVGMTPQRVHQLEVGQDRRDKR